MLSTKENISSCKFDPVFLKCWDLHYEEEKYEGIIEDFMAILHKDEQALHDPMEDQTHEEHMDEGASHVSMVDQEHEDKFDEESPQASIPSFHENKGLVSHDTLPISEFNEAFLED